MWGIAQIAGLKLCTPLRRMSENMNAGNPLKHILHLLPPLGGANWGVYQMPDFYLMRSHMHIYMYMYRFQFTSLVAPLRKSQSLALYDRSM